MVIFGTDGIKKNVSPFYIRESLHKNNLTGDGFFTTGTPYVSLSIIKTMESMVEI